MKKIKYERHDRFEKQLKRLIKKYRSLEEDLKIARTYAIEAFHVAGINNESVALVPKFNKETIRIYKVKKFACRALKGKGVKSGIRVIYAFYPKESRIEFLEIYFKEKNDSDMDYGFIQKIIKAYE